MQLHCWGLDGRSDLVQDPGKTVTGVDGSELWNGDVLEEVAQLVNASGLGLMAVEETGTRKPQ